MDDDAQLLQDYAKNRSEAAFAALTARYVGLVYSSCCRQLRDRHLAEDATQAVFVIVGQKAAAGSLRAATLAGWLLTTARYTCANVRRTELRRRRHETAVAMGGQSKAADEDLLALLDGGLARLREKDRQAIALRYLQGRPLRDVGAALGVSEEAAGKRVTRCVQKLRKYFAHRGIVSAPAMVAAVLEMQAAAGAAALDEAARTQLTLGILQACQGGAGAGAAPSILSLAKGANTMMQLARVKVAAGLLLVVAALAAGGWSAMAVIGGEVTTTTTTPTSAGASTRPIVLSIAPTTAPDADLSTPFAMCESLSRALKNGDAAGAYACLNVDPHRMPTAMDCLLAENLAHSRWQRAARRAFPKSNINLYQIVTADQVIDVLLAVARARGETPAINGNVATITITIPPEVAASFPPHAQVFARRWSGQVLHFTKQGEQWKLDEIPMQTVDTNTGRALTDTEAQIAGLMAYADVLDQLTTKVQAKRITSMAQAQGVFDAECDRLARLYPGFSPNTSTVPLEHKQ